MVRSRSRALLRAHMAGLAVAAMVLAGAASARAEEGAPVADPPLEQTTAHPDETQTSAEGDTPDGSGTQDGSGTTDGGSETPDATDAPAEPFEPGASPGPGSAPGSATERAEIGALAASGTVSGRVTQEADPELGLPGVMVTAWQVGGDGFGEVETGASGEYSIGGLPTGDYVVLFEPDENYAYEFWEDSATRDTSTKVAVVDGAEQAGIDAQLAAAAWIEGSVRNDADGAPIAGAWAVVYTADGAFVGETQTDETGFYRLGGLPRGSYYVYFESDDDAFVPQFWDGAYEWEDAGIIQIEAGDTARADARLLPNQSISGIVTRSSDGAAVKGFVSAATADGGAHATAQIDADGGYTLFLTPGQYVLRFTSYTGDEINEYWEDARDEADATAITIGAGDHLEGFDAELEATGMITGVIDGGDLDVYDLYVEAYDGDVMVGMAYADASGRYTLQVPAGTYVLRAGAIVATGQEQPDPRYYDGADSAADATPVTVGAAEVRDGIDFSFAIDEAPVTPVEPGTPARPAVPRAPALAQTGADAPLPAVAAALLMLIAGGALVAARRRPERQSR